MQPSVVPAWLTAPVLSSNGRLRCVLTGEAGASYTIQVSSDLTSWIPLTNLVTTAAGTSEFTDAAPAGASRRFYRAVRP